MPLTAEQSERLRVVLDRRAAALAERNLSLETQHPNSVRAGNDKPTQREIQVLQLAADGGTNKEIAIALELSEETVKCYIKRLLFKLSAKNRAGAVAIGLRTGLIV